jgi:hypothetical protein
VYPPELTQGFDTPLVAGSTVGPLFTYENLKNMEMLVVARVLSRPEPATGFYVSKSWCKAALQWLEVQQEQFNGMGGSKKPKKLSKKQQRIRNRRLSDASPPWPNVNSDLLCPHSNLQRCGTKASRARRRVLDKQAWKVLKRLYPDSKPLESVEGECLQCLMEEEMKKKSKSDHEERERQRRKLPLSCPLVRGLYTRSRGVPPSSSLEQAAGKCPLMPGVYSVLPRAWCYKWRRYLKTGDETCPFAPCASELLCDAHRLPLIPPHLESYLYGETLQLLGSSGEREDAPPASSAVVAVLPGRMDLNDETVQALRAAGLSRAEVACQRLAMMNLERQQQQQQAPVALSSSPTPTKEQLDRENSVVVEILTQDEWIALQKWWPKMHSALCLGFTVGQDGGITWSTPPCRDCDPSGHLTRCDLYVKNRARTWIKKSSSSSRPPASLEY